MLHFVLRLFYPIHRYLKIYAPGTCPPEFTHRRRGGSASLLASILNLPRQRDEESLPLASFSVPSLTEADFPRPGLIEPPNESSCLSLSAAATLSFKVILSYTSLYTNAPNSLISPVTKQAGAACEASCQAISPFSTPMATIKGQRLANGESITCPPLVDLSASGGSLLFSYLSHPPFPVNTLRYKVILSNTSLSKNSYPRYLRALLSSWLIFYVVNLSLKSLCLAVFVAKFLCFFASFWYFFALF